MRGRKLFSIARPALLVCAAILKLVPKQVCVPAYELIGWLPGLVGVGLRYIFVRRLARSCGDVVLIGQGTRIKGWDRLDIGTNVSIQEWCNIDASGGVQIKDDVSIAHGCSIISFDHQWVDSSLPIRDNEVIFSSVTIGPDVWIGAGVKVLSGVSIGTRVVVGAAAVVSRDIPDRSLAIGVPAKVFKKI